MGHLSSAFRIYSRPILKPVFGPFIYVCFGLFASFVATASFAFDNEKAKKSFKKCAACHEIGPGAKNKVGPHLNGLENRSFGTIPYYQYSKAMKKAGEDGAVWSAENLDQFLLKPKAFMKKTRMSFGGIKKDETRKNLVLWLLHFDLEGNELSERADANGTNSVLLGASAAALVGDSEYGQYLSGECVTCHKVSGEDDGIPSIIGWPKENFIDALYQYKTEARENPVMRTVTKRLGDEEMAALAAYFGSLKAE